MCLANAQMYIAEAGTTIFIPAGTIHNFKNIGTQTGTLLITLTSGSQKMQTYCNEVKICASEKETLAQAAKAYDVIID